MGGPCSSQGLGFLRCLPQSRPPGSSETSNADPLPREASPLCCPRAAVTHPQPHWGLSHTRTSSGGKREPLFSSLRGVGESASFRPGSPALGRMLWTSDWPRPPSAVGHKGRQPEAGPLPTAWAVSGPMGRTDRVRPETVKAKEDPAGRALRPGSLLRVSFLREDLPRGHCYPGSLILRPTMEDNSFWRIPAGPQSTAKHNWENQAPRFPAQELPAGTQLQAPLWAESGQKAGGWWKGQG